MSIRSGDLIHVADQLLIDRAQTIGVSNLNQPQDRVYEVGNYRTVGIVRDIPDLSWGVESVDASAAFEALLVGGNALGAASPPPAADADGTIYDIGAARVLDVVGQFKRGRQFPDPQKFDTLASIATPQLTLESLSYRYGMRQNAAQTASLRGDSVFFSEGSGFVEQTTGAAFKAGYALAHNAIPYHGDVNYGVRYVLNARVDNGRRLRVGVDFTEAAGAQGSGALVGTYPVTATLNATDVQDADVIFITYQSPTVANFPQNVHTPDSLVKPAAVRGKDITVVLAPQGEYMFTVPTSGINHGLPADPTFYLTGVQSIQADWRVTLQNDEEFGNSQYVGTDYDVAATSGNVEIKPTGPHDLMERVRQICGLASGAVESIGPYQVATLQLAMLLHSPIDGHVLKTLYVPDARFVLPTGQMRTQQKLSWQFPWEGISGDFYVSKGVLKQENFATDTGYHVAAPG